MNAVLKEAHPVGRMLELSGVRKRFGDKEVLKGVDLELGVGQTLALIGASGSGKTTLLRCINFLEQPDSGEVRVDGERRTVPISATGLRRQRAEIGMVFQHFNLFPHFTALQNIAEGPRSVRGIARDEAHELGQRLLQQVGLGDKAGHFPHQLSGGQQQRVAIARALAMKPKLMLFDEPTSALDPELVGEVLNVMRDLAAGGMTMVVVTHEMAFAEDVADEVVFMDDGLVVEQGAPAQVLRQPQHPRTRSFLQRLNRAR
jgi:polar amino acid transport system ATP-binding protein